MKKTADDLIGFYFGSLEESERLRIERALLEDPEILVEYLDLKRALEAAAPVPQAPSPRLWVRLQPQAKRRAFYVGFGAAAALAAAVVAFLYLRSAPRDATEVLKNGNGIIFDSSAEHSRASDVL